ncbi:hypothetical protein ACFWBF_11275 [Streptomyces sp. NPDC060028]|uniref:hypothetical protein n=1 Tax=Streptomyces sp. NPDC060028 TaxID=3347041 RepID=UPI0036AE5A21
MTLHKAPEFFQITRRGAVTAELRRELIDCWTAVAGTRTPSRRSRFGTSPKFLVDLIDTLER